MERLNLPSNYKVGIDLVYLKRFENKIADWHFIEKILTLNEIALYKQLKHHQHQINFLAGRFACKEAYAKALKKGIGLVDFHDVEILKDSNNAPIINVENADVSISHEQDYVIAIIILEVSE